MRTLVAWRFSLPAWFVVALVCFFFSFVGVSCNTDAARQALSGIGGSAGATVPAARLNQCIDSLAGRDVLSYTGLDGVFDSAPSTLTQGQSSCSVAQVAPGSAATLQPTAADATLGVQPLAVLAFVTVCAGLLLGVLVLVRLLPEAPAVLASIVLALVALLTLLLNQAHMQSQIVQRLDAQASASGAPVRVSDYFIVSTGGAVWIAVTALSLAVLMSVAALLLRPPPSERAPDVRHSDAAG